MVPLGIHFLILLSLPLTTLCRMYKVVIEPAEADLCLVFTVANGGNETQADDPNHERIGSFNWTQKKCIWADSIETDEDRCDPQKSKDAYIEPLVREIRQHLIQNYNMVPVFITRQRENSDEDMQRENSGQGKNTSGEWDAFDDAIEKAVNQNCSSRRGLVLDFIAGNNDQCGNLITLGYLISGTDLMTNDTEELNLMENESSIRAMIYHEHITFADLILLLGRKLNAEFKNSARIVPSPASRWPESNETETCYRSGGATTKTYGSRSGKFSMDAIQIGIPIHFMMEDIERQNTAVKMAEGIYKYMNEIHLT